MGVEANECDFIQTFAVEVFTTQKRWNFAYNTGSKSFPHISKLYNFCSYFTILCVNI